jgi:hypothetical protein
VPQSLHRTWTALGVATLAVLFVAFLVGRDFVRDVFPACDVSLETEPFDVEATASLVPVTLETTQPVPSSPRWFQLRFDEKTDAHAHAPVTIYAGVRILWNGVALDGKPCVCGSIPITLSGETPSDLRLYRVEGTDQYVVKGRNSRSDLHPDFRDAFIVKQGPARHLQGDRIFTARHLPALVVWLALGALGVALLRSRRAMSYALRLHTWTEARLSPEGLIEGDTGETLATLAAQGWTTRIPDGPVLVAPEALSRASLYRDMPVVQRRDVAEGTHARWASGTMLRLRDARALAIISTLCTLLALGARTLG